MPTKLDPRSGNNVGKTEALGQDSSSSHESDTHNTHKNAGTYDAFKLSRGIVDEYGATADAHSDTFCWQSRRKERQVQVFDNVGDDG